MFDEREENFREMAALGNVKAMKAYLRGGVNIDGQNKVNGQTALHWACVRGNSDAVELLVRAGADTTIKNNKGQTPLEVCKEDSTRALLPNYRKGEDSSGGSAVTKDRNPSVESSEAPFVPSYMANPDLSKAWGIPEDAMMPAAQGESGYVQQLQFEASMSKNKPSSKNVVASVPAAAENSIGKPEEQELLVYSNHYSEENLLGSVYVDANNQTIADLKTQLVNEIDDMPENGAFSISRYNGKQTVPINAKQA
ncbi:hypothetical protein LPJ59_000445, partial [Coemansia sp. RSA 2399]